MSDKHSKNNKNDNSKNNNISIKETKKKNTITFFSLLICISLLIYSGIQILNWFKDTNKIKNEMTQINEVVTITEVSKEVNDEIIETKEEKSSPYYDYIQMNLIDVNVK